MRFWESLWRVRSRRCSPIKMSRTTSTGGPPLGIPRPAVAVAGLGFARCVVGCTAPVACQLAGVCTWLCLVLGTRLPARPRPFGQGLLASPIWVPSFQSCDRCSGEQTVRLSEGTGLAALCPPLLCVVSFGGEEEGLRYTLSTREDLVFIMAAKIRLPAMPLPPGTFPVWSTEGLGPG